MANVVKTFSFLTDGEGFVFTDVSSKGSTGAWQSTGGNPTGCWYINVIGRKYTHTSYIELTTTWEALGVAAGFKVTQILANSVDWACDVFNVGDDRGIGAFEIRDSGGTLQMTLFAHETGTGTLAWTTKNGTGSIAVPSAINASDSTINIRLNTDALCGNNVSAEVNLLIDNIVLSIDSEEILDIPGKINIGDVWKTMPIGGTKINIGGVWKTVVAIKQNIGDVWKDVL